MTAADFFYLSAGAAIWISLITWIFVFYKIIHIATKAELEIQSVKNTLKLTGLNLISKILDMSKGGEKK